MNLDQAQKNVRNAQNQLDQALKELEKAKKPKVWEKTYDGWVNVCGVDGHVYSNSETFGPCKVTVRPIGGPEPCNKVVERGTVWYGDGWYLSNAPSSGKRLLVTVEEI